jgi:hypothetical protein
MSLPKGSLSPARAEKRICVIYVFIISADPNLDFNKNGQAFYLSTSLKDARYWMTKKCLSILQTQQDEVIVGAILIFKLDNAKIFFEK